MCSLGPRGTNFTDDCRGIICAAVNMDSIRNNSRDKSLIVADPAHEQCTLMCKASGASVIVGLLGVSKAVR